MPPIALIRARIDSAMPWRSAATASGSNPLPAVADEDRRPARARPRRTARPIGAPDHLAALTVASRPACQQRSQIVVERAVADGDHVDGTPWRPRPRSAIRSTPAASVRRRRRRRRPAAALEQPGAQLALLGPGQLDDLLRVVGGPLDQGQGLQHRVVDAGGHVAPAPRPGCRAWRSATRSRASRSHHGPEDHHGRRHHEQRPSSGRSVEGRGPR